MHIQSAFLKHMIVPDGYDIGRDLLVERAVQGSHWKGMKWVAEVEWNEGDLLKEGSWSEYNFVLF